MSDNKDHKKDASQPSVSTRFEEDFPTSMEDHILPSTEDKNALHEQIEVLNKTLQEEQEKASSYWERLLRKEAEMQNIQRRAEIDVKNARDFAIERFASELLEVADNLERGLDFTQNGQATIEHLIEGMTLTQSVLLNALDKQGIKPIQPAPGDAFDPAFHQALSMQETTEVEPNKILAVIQKGYMLHQRLLRPARVIVSKAPTA